MEVSRKKSRITLLLLALLYGCFLYWYGGYATPLTQEEAEAYLSQIVAAEGGPSPGLRAGRMRAFAEGDDGRDFYMVNLVRYRDTAEYPEGKGAMKSVEEAREEYAGGIMPLLLRRAAHPALLGTPITTFLPGTTDEDLWDIVAIVRYRSRRDFFDSITSPEFRAAVVHKWASVEHTMVVPTSFFWFPSLRFVLLVLFAATWLFVRGRENKAAEYDF